MFKHLKAKDPVELHYITCRATMQLLQVQNADPSLGPGGAIATKPKRQRPTKSPTAADPGAPQAPTLRSQGDPGRKGNPFKGLPTFPLKHHPARRKLISQWQGNLGQYIHLPPPPQKKTFPMSSTPLQLSHKKLMPCSFCWTLNRAGGKPLGKPKRENQKTRWRWAKPASP